MACDWEKWKERRNESQARRHSWAELLPPPSSRLGSCQILLMCSLECASELSSQEIALSFALLQQKILRHLIYARMSCRTLALWWSHTATKVKGVQRSNAVQAGELLLDYIDAKLVYAARIGEKVTHTDMYRVQPALQEESRKSIILSHFISALWWLNLLTKDDEWNPGYTV